MQEGMHQRRPALSLTMCTLREDPVRARHPGLHRHLLLPLHRRRLPDLPLRQRITCAIHQLAEGGNRTSLIPAYPSTFASFFILARVGGRRKWFLNVLMVTIKLERRWGIGWKCGMKTETKLIGGLVLESAIRSCMYVLLPNTTRLGTTRYLLSKGDI